MNLAPGVRSPPAPPRIRGGRLAVCNGLQPFISTGTPTNPWQGANRVEPRGRDVGGSICWSLRQGCLLTVPGVVRMLRIRGVLVSSAPGG